MTFENKNYDGQENGNIHDGHSVQFCANDGMRTILKSFISNHLEIK